MPVKTLPPRLSSPMTSVLAGSASAPAPHAPWAKIGLVNLDFTGKEPGVLHRSAPQALIDPLAGLAVDPSQFARRQRRYVRTKHLQ